ncbi:MAG: pilus assembly protein PilM [Patescibacteria group bacterium]|nr:pilus assembly protein PilM [Patescibacteria group bacterium]
MAARLFPRIFPVPKLLSMGSGGIEISGHTIKYLRFDDRSERPRVLSFGEHPLPSEAVISGEIRNKGALTEALRAVRKSCGFSFAHVALPEQKGYLFDLVLPKDDTPLSDRIAIALPEYVPLSPAEVVYDCETVRSESDEFTRSLVVTAFPEVAAQSYVEALAEGGFSPLSFELEPQAAGRALAQHAKASGAHLLIDFGVHKSVLSIMQNGVVRFATSAEGTLALDEGLRKRAAAAGIPQEKIEGELERIKFEEGLAPEGVSAPLFSTTAGALASSIGKVMVYWQSRTQKGERREKLSSIILYGGNANMLGLSEYLARTVGLPAAAADLRPALGGEGVVPPIPRFESLRYATVIGLAERALERAIW